MSITIDETRVEAFVERLVDEIGAAVNVPLAVIGARLGLYAAMADAQPVTAAELAARTFPGTGYDLVACFDSLHELGDPAAAARHVRSALSPDGTWMIGMTAAPYGYGKRLSSGLARGVGFGSWDGRCCTCSSF
jgi:hypothetical protein